jgi:hypothetical protein
MHSSVIFIAIVFRVTDICKNKEIMGTLSGRIRAFEKLGEKLEEWCAVPHKVEAIQRTLTANPWFRTEDIVKAMLNLRPWLSRESLETWCAQYEIGDRPDIRARVALIMAGNLPLVNFHDALAVLIQGHQLLAKTSSRDPFLFPFLMEELISIYPEFSRDIQCEAGMLKDFDAVIATGSDNSSRYFSYYFGKYPHIIRHNRSSVGILSGTETDAEIDAFGSDVFDYFGLGCRSISLFLIPEWMDSTRLAAAWKSYAYVGDHSSYFNNYEYRKAILLINSRPHLDSGFFLLEESCNLHSPIGVLNVGRYRNEEDLCELRMKFSGQTQVTYGYGSGLTLPGTGQSPGLTDYPDGIDTMKFLKNWR